jgi:hypothetical protein
MKSLSPHSFEHMPRLLQVTFLVSSKQLEPLAQAKPYQPRDGGGDLNARKIQSIRLFSADAKVILQRIKTAQQPRNGVIARGRIHLRGLELTFRRVFIRARNPYEKIPDRAILEGAIAFPTVAFSLLDTLVKPRHDKDPDNDKVVNALAHGPLILGGPPIELFVRKPGREFPQRGLRPRKPAHVSFKFGVERAELQMPPIDCYRHISSPSNFSA